MSRFALFPKRHRMMTCRQVGRVLQAYLDGEVDDLAAQRITHHLNHCRRCGMELEVYTEIKATLRRGGGPVDSEALDRLRSFSQQLAGRTGVEAADDEESPGG